MGCRERRTCAELSRGISTASLAWTCRRTAAVSCRAATIGAYGGGTWPRAGNCNFSRSPALLAPSSSRSMAGKPSPGAEAKAPAMASMSPAATTSPSASGRLAIHRQVRAAHKAQRNNRPRLPLTPLRSVRGSDGQEKRSRIRESIPCKEVRNDSFSFAADPRRRFACRQRQPSRRHARRGRDGPGRRHRSPSRRGMGCEQGPAFAADHRRRVRPPRLSRSGRTHSRRRRGPRFPGRYAAR